LSTRAHQPQRQDREVFHGDDIGVHPMKRVEQQVAMGREIWCVELTSIFTEVSSGNNTRF
jgi:hypothetical protein